MSVTRSILLSCLVALCAIACASEPEPSATEATEPEATSGAEQAPPEPAVVEAEPPAAAPTPEPEPPKPPTAGVLITHKVKDYDAWKTAFDAHEQGRRDGGLVAHALLLDPAKKNTVSIWAGTHDLAKAEAMLASEELKQVMKDAGVIGKPTIAMMNVVEMSSPAQGGEMPKFGAVLDAKVKDFDAWKAAFDAHAQTRTEAGIAGWAINQDPKDPTHVYVWLEAHEKEKLAAFLKSKDLKDRMKESGVKGAPKTTQLDIVEWKMYGQ